MKLFYLSILLFSNAIFACSLAPSMESFVINPGYHLTKKPLKPRFELIKVKRGYDDGNYASCSDAGIITIKAISKYTSNAVAYKFEIVAGELEDSVFPEGAVQSLNGNEFYFVWLDGSSNKQEPIEIILKIVALSPSGIESEPSLLRISHPGT
jgi:hypothetical protein